MTFVERIAYHAISKPLALTFATSLGSKDIIQSVVVDVTLSDGSAGSGEIPTSHSLKKENIPAIERTIEEISPRLLHSPVEGYREKISELRRGFPLLPMTISGFEVALFRAFLASKGVREHQYWGKRFSSIETDITIPFSIEPKVVEKWVINKYEEGFSTFKVKVSGDVRNDCHLLDQIHALLAGRPGGVRLFLDGNQSYNVQTYLDMVDTIEKKGYSIECFEQPLPKGDLSGLREIKKCSSIPIILDESIFTTTDLEEAIAGDTCHGVNIKFAKSGISETEKIYRMAKKQGLLLMAGCMMETMTGLSAAIHFAAGTGGFDFVDLDSVHYLKEQTDFKGIRIKGPKYEIEDLP